MDLALVAHAATLETRIPFLHFSMASALRNEVNKIEMLTRRHARSDQHGSRRRASPARAISDHPCYAHGTESRCLFSAREAGNPYYDVCPGQIQAVMDKLPRSSPFLSPVRLRGRADADRVIVMWVPARRPRTNRRLSQPEGRKGWAAESQVVPPFSVRRFIEALPQPLRKIAVLDRTKESGAAESRSILDIVNGITRESNWATGKAESRARNHRRRYGLSSKEFTPARSRRLDKPEKQAAKDHFRSALGRRKPHQSRLRAEFSIEPTTSCERCSMASAAMHRGRKQETPSRSSAKTPPNYGQGYFVYDSKKSGAMTVSQLALRPAAHPLQLPNFQSNFVACHQWIFLERYDMLGTLVPAASSCSIVLSTKTKSGTTCRAKSKPS